MRKRTKKINLLWITDPFETLDHRKDTTLRLIEESHALGYRQSWCCPADFSLSEKSRIFSRELSGIGPDRASESITFKAVKAAKLNEYSHVFFRVDPPVNTSFLMSLQLLRANLDVRKTEVVNPVETLSLLSEKLIPLSIPKFTPPTLVTNRWDDALVFYRKHKKILLKPLNGAQSKGISIPETEAEFRERFLALTSVLTSAPASPSGAIVGDNEFSPCLLQKFSPEISNGEKRLWFSDGKLLCFGQKKPRAGDFIINMDGGGSVVAEPLTKKEKNAVPQIARVLKVHGIRWAAVDLIDGLITDFNHTSPGLISQLELVWSENFARPLMKRTLG